MPTPKIDGFGADEGANERDSLIFLPALEPKLCQVDFFFYNLVGLVDGAATFY